MTANRPASPPSAPTWRGAGTPAFSGALGHEAPTPGVPPRSGGQPSRRDGACSTPVLCAMPRRSRDHAREREPRPEPHSTNDDVARSPSLIASRSGRSHLSFSWFAEPGGEEGGGPVGGYKVGLAIPPRQGRQEPEPLPQMGRIPSA